MRHGARWPGRGESAVALSWVINPNPWPDYPSTQFYYTQSVYQFPSTKAAATYYNQARAKYAKCRAFQVGQISDLTDQAGITIQQSTLVTVEGTDVFTMNSVGGTNDPVPTSLMLKLINRVKKLR